VAGKSARHLRVLCSLSAPEKSSLEESPEPVHVRLAINDVSLADEAATTVAHADVVVPAGQDLAGPFELVADLAPGHHFAVTVHVDRSGDGQLAPGDLITTQRVQVPADSKGGAVLVEVPLTVLT
jgi:uncharacterized lipoprotein YbaY